MWTAEAGGGGNYISVFFLFFFKDSTGYRGFPSRNIGLRSIIRFILSVVVFKGYLNGIK